MQKNNLIESVDDPGAFKAVVFVGGPGSGKSYVASQLYGMPKGINFTAGGLRNVNFDTPYEYLIKKRGMSSDLSAYTPEEESRILGPLRNVAWNVRERQLKRHMQEGTGVLLDTTGANPKTLMRDINRLKAAGYDITVVHVDTPVELALQRNRQRARRLPDDVIRNVHKKVEENMAMIKSTLGDKMITVQNGDGADIKQMEAEVGRIIRRSVEAPVENPVGRQRLRDESGGAVTKSLEKKMGRTRRNKPESQEEKKTRYREILKMPIKNPQTGKIIQVGTVLKAGESHPAYRAAVNFVKQQMQRK